MGSARTDREIDHAEETQEGKTRCHSAQDNEEGDGEEEKRDGKTGAKARTHHARSVAAAKKIRAK